ncbi:LysE family translocator, partial [Rhizobium sp. SEMIA 4085]|nr:LysE family translocator [Rhizobium sp. SEMIA 4085]
AAPLALCRGDRPFFRRAQRMLMATVLGGLAVRMALESRR